jgi:hypothetical protein
MRSPGAATQKEKYNHTDDADHNQGRNPRPHPGRNPAPRLNLSFQAGRSRRELRTLFTGYMEEDYCQSRVTCIEVEPGKSTPTSAA